MRTVEIVALLVAVATVVAVFAGRLRVPAPSLLVAAGLGVGLVPGAPIVHVPPAVVGLVVLPPLLYAASEELPWRDLRAVWRPVAVLAVTAALIATRVAWVFPVLALSGGRRGTRRPSWPTAAVVSWAGTRGVVPLAAALSIPSPPPAGLRCRSGTWCWCWPPPRS